MGFTEINFHVSQSEIRNKDKFPYNVSFSSWHVAHILLTRILHNQQKSNNVKRANVKKFYYGN